MAVPLVALFALLFLPVIAQRAPIPDAGQQDPWSVPFLTRPVSGPIRLNGCSDVVIENRTFKDLGPDVEAIHLENCQRVTMLNRA